LTQSCVSAVSVEVRLDLEKKQKNVCEVVKLGWGGGGGGIRDNVKPNRGEEVTEKGMMSCNRKDQRASEGCGNAARKPLVTMATAMPTELEAIMDICRWAPSPAGYC